MEWRRGYSLTKNFQLVANLFILCYVVLTSIYLHLVDCMALPFFVQDNCHSEVAGWYALLVVNKLLV